MSAALPEPDPRDTDSPGPTPVEDLSACALADRVRATREIELAAGRDLLVLACQWADTHPGLDDHGRPYPRLEFDQDALAAHFAGLDPDDALDTPAWAGLPPVAWDAPAGLGAAANLSTQAARALLRDALVLRHRLPGLWTRVRAGKMPAWRARQVAKDLAGAPDDIAAAIDAAITPVADRIGPVTLRRLIDEAMVALHPDLIAEATRQRLGTRGVHLDTFDEQHTGLASLEIRTDLPDLADLHHTLTQLAKRIVEVDPALADESLDVRRAIAAGILADPARADQILNPHTPDNNTDADGDAPDGRRSSWTKPLGVTLVIRLSEAALSGTPGAVASVDGGPVTLADRVAHWCSRESRAVHVIGVIDPDAAHHTTGAYRPTTAITHTLELRDGHCRFPHCTRPAHHCDQDHAVPFAQGGATCECQLVPLCRHHHRLKTHRAYDYDILEPGVVTWTTPHGHHYLVDHTGTHPLTGIVPAAVDPTGPGPRHNGCLARAG